MRSLKIFCIALNAAMFFYVVGCGKDENSVTNAPPTGGGAFTLSGTISGYPGGSLMARATINKLIPPDSFFVGTDTVDNDGVLSMSLVTPPTDFLVPIAVPAGITVSDTSCRIVTFGELRAYNFSNVIIGHIVKKNFDDTAIQGSFSIMYFFCTKAVSITGSDTSINLTDTSITVYNVNAASGWVALTLELSIERPNFSQVEFRSGETAGATWRYHAVPQPLVSGRKLLRPE